MPLVLLAPLLGGPFVLAFFSGGFFTGPRLVAGVVAWVCVVIALLSRGDAPPLRREAVAALGGLALLVLWTALSSLWSPLGAGAADSLERGLLYLGALVASFLVLRRGSLRLVEPALAFGTVVVIGYGLAGRVLPDLVELTRTRSAGGRLDQPLTYWNATGAFAAIGLVLCARLAGDRTRPLALRAAAAASAAPLGLGVYLSFSRGALTALGVGLAVLLALAPTWPQLRAGAIALEASAVAVAVASLLPAVEAAEGDAFARQGAVLLVVLLVVMAGAAALQVWSARAESDDTTRTGPLPPAVPRAALAVAAVLAVAPFFAAAIDQGDDPEGPAFGATAERFGSVGSRRYAYWEAALKGFAEKPLHGHGAGAYSAIWLEERDVRERVVDAHSLELETAAELGVVGLLLLGLFVTGVAVAARRGPPGAAAALAVYGAHSAIDWDWELPALTLVAIVLAGAVLAATHAGATTLPARMLRRWRYASSPI